MEPILVCAITGHQWIPDTLTQQNLIRVVHDQGFDAPDTHHPLYWWTPTQRGARLRHAGVPLAPDFPPARWRGQ